MFFSELLRVVWYQIPFCPTEKVHTKILNCKSTSKLFFLFVFFLGTFLSHFRGIYFQQKIPNQIFLEIWHHFLNLDTTQNPFYSIILFYSVNFLVSNFEWRFTSSPLSSFFNISFLYFVNLSQFHDQRRSADYWWWCRIVRYTIIQLPWWSFTHSLPLDFYVCFIFPPNVPQKPSLFIAIHPPFFDNFFW